MLAVTGACLMVRKQAFEEVGGFAEILAVAFNDVDLCYSLYEAGYYNVVRRFTAKATAICWIPSVSLRKEAASFISGRRMSICFPVMNLLAIYIMIFSRIRAWKCW